jgi:hypothetical protein
LTSYDSQIFIEKKNVEVDALSKKEQLVAKGMVIMERVKDGIHTISKTLI